MRTNKAGRDLIKQWEGLRLEAYPDPASPRAKHKRKTGKDDASLSGAPWTIGYGHTRGVVPGMRITPAQAEALLDEDLSLAEAGVLECCRGVQLNENEFAALVSFVFNVGADIDTDDKPEGLGDSSLLKKLIAGNRADAADAFRAWKFAGGEVNAGLVARRAAERELFLSRPK